MAATEFPAGVGRILKRFPPRPQHSQNFLGSACGGVEKSARYGVKEALHHLVDDALCEIEIAQVSGGLIGIEAGDCGEGIIVEQARNQPPLSGRVGIGEHMLQTLLRLPGFGEDAVQRTQREVFGRLELEHLRGLQVGRNAK